MEILVLFPPIFVTETKIIFSYNFIASSTSLWYLTIYMWILLHSHDLLYPYLSLTPFFFLIKLWENLSNLLIKFSRKWKFPKWIELKQFSLSLCIYSGLSLVKMSKQFLYKYQYQRILIFSVIWLDMKRLKYNSFDTDIVIQIM